MYQCLEISRIARSPATTHWAISSIAYAVVVDQQPGPQLILGIKQFILIIIMYYFYHVNLKKKKSAFCVLPASNSS